MNELPDEILRHVFSYLPLKERLRLEQICKKWSLLMPYNVTKLDLIETFIPKESQRKADTFPLTNVVCSLLQRCGQHVREISFGKVYLLITFVIIDRIDECCPNLEALDLSYCTVTESIVPSLMALSNRLISLNLGNTVFSLRNIDQHKDNMAMFFSQMDRLEKINLQKTNVHNLTAVYFLPPTLKSLNLNSCAPLRLDVLADLLTRCNNLEELRLSAYTQINQLILETICSLPNLIVLELSHVAFAEIVFHTDHDEPLDFSIIKEITKLEKLYVQYNNQINDKVLSDICGRCKNLNTLNISYCRHLGTFTPLSWLNNLQEIYFAASTVTDDDLELLIKRSTLRTFRATSCSLGDRSLLLLAQFCPKLIDLSFNQCETVTSESVNLLLRNCTNLQNLSLQGSEDLDSRIFDDIEPNSSSLCNLKMLDLSYCRRFNETGILKLNEILSQRYHLGSWRMNKIIVYVHQTKVIKNVQTLIEPNLLSIQM